jgi:hypothetical protein
MEKMIALRKLQHSELQFKLALAVSATCLCSDENTMKYIGIFSYGKHTMEAKELSLSPEEEKLGAVILEHTATYLMILQLDEVLEKTFPNRFENDSSIRDGACIVRLIRNAYAHDPLSPTWLKIPSSWRNQTFKVDGIIALDTKSLEGKKLERLDYGGPISLLRLLQYFRHLIEAM